MVVPILFRQVSDPSLDDWKSTKELQTSHSDGVLDLTISEELNAALKSEKQLVHQLASAENQVRRKKFGCMVW